MAARLVEADDLALTDEIRDVRIPEGSDAALVDDGLEGPPRLPAAKARLPYPQRLRELRAGEPFARVSSASPPEEVDQARGALVVALVEGELRGETNGGVARDDWRPGGGDLGRDGNWR